MKRVMVPRTRAGGEWTEARFWQFVRSGLRQMSQRYPPIARHALNAARKPYKGKLNSRLKWIYRCSRCKRWYKRKGVQVDHILECGSLKSADDLKRFIMRMFCEPNGLRILCYKCHALRRKGRKA